MLSDALQSIRIALIVMLLSENIRKIHREPHLCTNSGARDVLATKYAEIKTHAMPKQVLPSGQDLELTPAQICVFRIPTIDLRAERQPGSEVVQNRYASRINVAACVLYSQHTGAGISGKQIAQIPVHSGPIRKGLLRN